jgi:hypothetical protein
MKLFDVFCNDTIDLSNRLDNVNKINHKVNMSENVLSTVNVLPTMEDEEIDEVYPGQSSGRLKNWIASHYGGKITCAKAAKVKNDANASNFYKKRASWYQSLHCKGRKQIREDDPSVGSALTIFDIDDTLFRTDANVYLKDNSGNKRKLSSKEFNKHTLQDGEQYDFDEFKDAKRFNKTSKPIQNIWKTAQNTLENIGKRPGSRVVIVTARGDLDDKDLFLDTFRQHGLDMDKVHVYRAGNIKHGSSADKKKIVIRNLLESSDFTEVRLFDDYEENLEEFLKLSEEFPDIVFKAFPVSSQGKIGQPIITCGNIES